MFVLRISLGIGEAAFVGIPFYLSFFYKRDELALRTGLFISAAPLATSFAGSLAWLIIKFGDHIPIASWRLLFLLEGFPSIVVAVFVFLKIPDSPESAKYLTPRERRVARLRLRKEDNSSDKKGQKGGLKWKEMRDTLLDPKSYLTAVRPSLIYLDIGVLIVHSGNVAVLQCSLQLTTRIPTNYHRGVSLPLPSSSHHLIT